MAERAVVRRGIAEALGNFVGAAAAAAVAALVWSLVSDRAFLDALWLCLLIVGGLACVGTLNVLHRAETMDFRAMLGRAPEGNGEQGGRVLTGVGLALLVGVPLLAAGTLVEWLA